MWDFEEKTEQEKINDYRRTYKQYGLAIFESFEEYVQNREEESEM